jgi:hypothetical protein
MLSMRLPMQRVSHRHQPATALARTGQVTGFGCGGAVKGCEWINLDFVSPDPGGGCGT